jgi:acyl-CoA synthetase (NDP forming)
VKNEYALEAVKDCVEKGVKGIIIESAGFAETGVEKFIDIQNKIVEICKQANVRVIGPNCVGITNFMNKFTTTEIDFDKTYEGGISIIAQSGVLGIMYLEWGSSQMMGFSKAITLGNKIDVDEVDMLEYLENDPDTKVIALYLEGTKRGKDFFNILKKMTKPIIILKNGRSDTGSNAVTSHTGSMAGNDRIYDAVFDQNPGIFRVNNFYEMFNIAQVFSMQPLPKGKNVAIITGSGSLGIMACDEMEKIGLSLAKLSSDTINTLKSIIPSYVSIGGTIDLGPSMIETLMPSLDAISIDENVDCVLFISAVPSSLFENFRLSMAPYFRRMKKISEKNNKPVIICVFGSRWVFEYLNKSAHKYNLPLMIRIKHAIKAFKMMNDFREYKEKKEKVDVKS